MLPCRPVSHAEWAHEKYGTLGTWWLSEQKPFPTQNKFTNECKNCLLASLPSRRLPAEVQARPPSLPVPTQLS